MIAMTVTDTLGRPLRDLRISVTDRCNFRCQPFDLLKRQKLGALEAHVIASETSLGMQ
jgi:hypothetical protein